MVAVAILIDLLPLIFILLAVGLVVYVLAGDVGQDMLDSVGGNYVDDRWNRLQILWKAGRAGAGGLMLLVFVGPLLYTVASFLSIFFGYLLFTFWFMFKGVNMWSFRSMQRVIVNLTAAVVELIPLVNLLPGISLMVWRHVKLSQMEDRVKNEENIHSISKQLARRAH